MQSGCVRPLHVSCCVHGADPLLFRQVIDGQAELFGAELAPKRWHYFVAGYKGAVFSWEGCTLEMSPPLLFRL